MYDKFLILQLLLYLNNDILEHTLMCGQRLNGMFEIVKEENDGEKVTKR